ncbi:MAG: ferritin [Ignavibacteriaceae bacterium]
MISAKMQKALNDQVNEEMFSSYLYLSMAAYFEAKNLKGFANWFRVQSQEEQTHAMKFFNFILQKGGKVSLKQIEIPKSDWKTIPEAFSDTFKHEQKITGLINKLVEVSMAEKDYATHTFLQWFVTEQVEEEANVEDLIQKLEMIGENKSGLYMIDNELGSRTFTPDAG